MPRLIDCFTFHNETNMLCFRIAELRHVVDTFVLVEATKTHSGEDKPLHFDKVAHLFPEVHIERVVVDDMPGGSDPWLREKHQRRCISRGLDRLGLADSDVITVCDVDEIPDSRLLETIKRDGIAGVYSLQQQAYCYNICCRIICDFYKGSWTHAKVADYYSAKSLGDLDALRFFSSGTLAEGGWHFSSFGDASFFQTKMRSYAHQENNTQDITAGAEDSIRLMRDPFLRPNPSMYVDPSVNPYLPRHWKMLDSADTKNIDVVMLTNTADEGIYQCAQQTLRTMRQGNPSISFNVIVVEGNLEAESSGFVLEGCRYLSVPGEFNYNRSLNFGLSHCKTDYILQINNDIIFRDGSVEELLRVMDSKGMQSACPLEPNYHNRGMPGVESEPYHEGYTVGQHLFGWCKCVRKRLLDKIGPYDERFVFYCQDCDYAEVLRSEGVRHYLVTTSHVQHMFGTSTRLIKENRENYLAKPRQVFQEKWGKLPDAVFYRDGA